MSEGVTRDTESEGVTVEVRRQSEGMHPWWVRCRGCRFGAGMNSGSRAKQAAQRHLDESHDGNGRVEVKEEPDG